MAWRPAANSGVEIVEFWAIGSEGEILPAMLERFHQQHPDIRVVVQQIPWNAAHEKLLTAFAGQSNPDLCQLGNTWIPEFTMLHALMDLGPWVERSSQIERDDYFSGIWATNTVDGHLYGVPWYVDTRVLFYRHDLLARAGWSTMPTTWDEWRQAMTAVQQRMPTHGHAILLPTNEWEQIVILGLQVDEPFLSDQYRFGRFRRSQFRDAFEFYLSLYQQGLAPVLASTEISNVWQELSRGMYAMYITGPWNMGEFRRRFPADELPKWSTAPLPSPNNDYPGRSMAGGCSLVMFANSRRHQAAWKVIEYLSDPEVQAEFFRRSGNLPARQTSWTMTALRDDPWADAFRQQLQRVVPTPQVPEWERIATRIYEIADRVIRGAATVEEGLEQLDRDVDRMLDKRRWLLDHKRLVDHDGRAAS